MLSPNKMKYRKRMKGKMRGMAKGGTELNFGQYGLQATECGKISAKQIEAARIAMTRHVKRGGKIWIRIFPDKPITKKPAEVRMGKGKGAVEGWVAVVRPGNMLFEVDGVSESIAQKALRLASAKLPIRTKFVKRGTQA